MVWNTIQNQVLNNFQKKTLLAEIEQLQQVALIVEFG
jgi:hypothetical protein